MATVTKSATSDLLQTPRGKLVFQVLGSQLDGQLIELSSGKCAIGSHPKCTFRICAPGIQPFHCFLIRGRAGVAVRAVSGPTQVNHSEVQEAALLPGDILTVGDVSLELAAIVDSQSEISIAALQPPTNENDVPHRVEQQIDALVELAETSQAATATEDVAEASPELQHRFDQLNQDHALLQADLESMRDELHERESQLAEHRQYKCELVEASEKLACLQRERDLLNNDLISARSRLDNDAQQLNSELAKVRGELEQRVAELAEQRQQQHDFSEAEKELQQLRLERDRLTTELAEAQERLDNDAQQLNSELAKVRGELEQREAELAEQRQQQHDFSKAEKELQQLRLERDRLTTELAEAHKRLDEQLSQHDQVSSSHREKLEAAQSAAKSLDTAVSGLQGELQNAQSQRGDWEARYHLLRAECEQANQQLNDAQDSLRQREDLLGQLKQANEKCQSLEQETSKLIAEIGRLQDELADARRLLQDNDNRESPTDLAENLRNKAEENHRLQAEIQSLQKEVSGSQLQTSEQLEAYASREAELRHELEQISVAVNELETDRQRWHDDREQLVTENKRLQEYVEQLQSASQASPQAQGPAVRQEAAEPNAEPMFESDDDQIQAYMNRLMQRSGAPTVPHQKSKPAYEAPSYEPRTCESPTSFEGSEPSGVRQLEEASSAQTADEEQVEDFEFVPRSEAPESTDHLNALRDVANHESRTAIHSSSRIRWKAAVLARVWLAALFLVLGFVMRLLGQTLGDVVAVGGTAFLVAGIWFGFQALRKYARFGNHDHAKLKSPLLEEAVDERANEKAS